MEADRQLELTGGARTGDGDGEPVAGAIRVANEVVAWIAALAALEVRGVHALYHSGGQQLDRVLRRGMSHRGVRVRIVDDGPLGVDLWIVMKAGANVASVGGEVQLRVASAIDRMLGLELAEVNVFVSEVVFG